VVKEGTLRVQATNSPSSFEVTTDGTGVVGHAGAALLRELADRVGLTKALGWRAAAARRHPDAAVLRDLAVVLADGGDCLSDLAALRDQPELFGPVASTPTAWRVLERVAADPDGLARLRAARAHGRALVGAASSVVAFTPAALLAAAWRTSGWFPPAGSSGVSGSRRTSTSSSPRTWMRSSRPYSAAWSWTGPCSTGSTGSTGSTLAVSPSNTARRESLRRPLILIS
jgi:hypothetical protein